MIKNRSNLFIAGAPRSGTTLVCNLLETYREILVFPTEHSTLEQFFWHRDDIESYARHGLIDSRAGGQQSFLFNEHLHARNQTHLKQQYGKNFPFSVDYNACRQGYLDWLCNRPANLENILFALAYSLSQGNAFAKNVFHTATWHCFKQPFFTELFALDAAALLPNSRFLHIVRDPIARYASAKSRRLRDIGTGNSLRPINRCCYVEGHTLIDVASRRLAQRNVEILGQERYRQIAFEDVVEAPSDFLSSIANWLSLDSEPNQSPIPTRLGEHVSAGSSISVSTNHAVDSTSASRYDVYRSITAWNERLIHSSLLDCMLHGTRPDFDPKLVAAFLVPLPRTSLKNYICQILGLSRWIGNQHENTLADFLGRARNGTVAISGVT